MPFTEDKTDLGTGEMIYDHGRRVFYEKYGVLVTNIRIEFGNTMYLIKNITSVQTSRIEKR